MEWKDSYDATETNGESEEAVSEKEGYSSWNNGKMNGLSFNMFKNPFVLTGMVVLILAVLSVIFISNFLKTEVGKQIATIEARLKHMEERLAGTEGIDKRVVLPGKESKTIEIFKNRLDGLESSSFMRMDHLSKKLDKIEKKLGILQKKTAGLKPEKAAAAKTGKSTKTVSKKRYCEVNAGDTLYSISRRYGLTVNELLNLNNLRPGTVIHPGQKLLTGD